jgi:hypothetical protein
LQIYAAVTRDKKKERNFMSVAPSSAAVRRQYAISLLIEADVGT